MAIINTYDQLKAAAAAGMDKRRLVMIAYHAPDRSNSRDVSTYQWSVSSPFFSADPNSHWSDYGSKVFLLLSNEIAHQEHKASALAKAMKWAERYNVKEWAKNRSGCYVPKEVNDNFPIRREK